MQVNLVGTNKKIGASVLNHEELNCAKKLNSPGSRLGAQSLQMRTQHGQHPDFSLVIIWAKDFTPTELTVFNWNFVVTLYAA